MAATVFAGQRASGLGRCAYSGGPALEMWGPLVCAAGRPVVVGRVECRSLEVRRAGRPVRVLPLMVGAYVAGGDMSLRAGTFDAVGDRKPVPERVGCPRLEWTAPGRAECPRRRLGCGRPWSPRKRAIRASPAGPRWGGARESGWKTWDASGPNPRKRPMSDKPDLFLVHLRSVQGSGILCGNCSTSYSGRRIPDRSGRPSVAVHQSNR